MSGVARVFKPCMVSQTQVENPCYGYCGFISQSTFISVHKCVR